MTNKIIGFLLVGMLCGQNAIAQQIGLTAVVVDRTTRAPLTGANVSLVNAKDTTEKYFAPTGKEGRVTFVALKEGRYSLRVSYLG